MSFPVPDSCTLPTAAQPIRRAEFATLFATALTRHERVAAEHLRLTFTGGADVADALRDLVAKESQCCSFFSFAISHNRDAIEVEIEVPPGQTAVLDGLSRLAATS